MSEKLGPVAFGRAKRQVFLGREMASPDEISEKTAELIDEEIRRLVDESLERARSLVRENEAKLHALANALLERETLTSEDVEEILGKRPGVPDDDTDLKRPLPGHQTPRAPGTGTLADRPPVDEPTSETEE